MARPFNSSPDDRLQTGTAFRPRGSNDKVLRGIIGHTTGNIRLTPGAATVAGSSTYNFGKLDDKAIGTYRLEWQAASPTDTATVQTSEPLGAQNRIEFQIVESAAGVYVTKLSRVGVLAGGVGADDAHTVNDAANELVITNTAVDNGTGAAVIPTNAKLFIGVANTSAGVIAAYGTPTGTAPALAPTLAVGDLFLNDATATGTRVYSITRLS